MKKIDWSIVLIIVMLIVGFYYTFIEDTPKTIGECDNINCSK